MLKPYLKKLNEIASYKDAREESFYEALSELLGNYAEDTSRKNVHITTLPKKSDAGNPDFRVWDGKQKIVGYVEAKTPDKNLDEIEKTEQLSRYLGIYPNLMLTNFVEFRLYRNGSPIDSVQIVRPYEMFKATALPKIEHKDEFFELLEKFFSFTFPSITDAKNLAIELAKRTKFLRDEVIAEELKEDGAIKGFYEAFKKYLMGNLKEDEFADLFAQTITYGLLAAREHSGEDFSRKLAHDKIPRTIGILRDIFRFISYEDLPAQMEWAVDDITSVLAATDVEPIMSQYFHEGKGEDPIAHFYETFLAEYDPTTREKRGVYYTPLAVVSYIVRSLNAILKEKFNRSMGFAETSVTVLDPATGTLTFVAQAVK